MNTIQCGAYTDVLTNTHWV